MRKIAEPAACEDDRLGGERMSIILLRRSEYGMFKILSHTGRVVSLDTIQRSDCCAAFTL